MNTLKLRQVFFDYDQKLDAGCTAFNAVGREPEFYENQYILECLDNNDHIDSKYWGLTSWRMGEKAKVNYGILKDEIERNPGYGAYIYYHYGSPENLRQNKETPIGKVIKRLYDTGVIPYRNDNLDWINVFCNYWVANPQVLERYHLLLKDVMYAMQHDEYIVDILNNNRFNHRGRKYPYNPFILEYLFGLFLLHNEDITYLRIPHMKTLNEIYQDYKDTAGWGDKGTLHHYIESYDRLFTPFRNKEVNILEIGVCKGHSVEMWRDYFPNGKVYGIDINKIEPIDGVTIYQCDQVDRHKLDELFKDVVFDIIVDDGSHKIQHQLLTAKYLWNKMKSGGLYIIEDIQEPEIDIPMLSEGFRKPAEVIDTREVSGRYDDILMVWIK